MNQDQLSLAFAALADPTRRAILLRLSHGETSVSELAQPFLSKMSAPAISKHLKVLEKAGLISKGRDAQWRPCSLNGEPLKQVSDWVGHYRQFWENSFDRLDSYIQKIKKQNQKPQEKKNAKRK